MRPPLSRPLLAPLLLALLHCAAQDPPVAAPAPAEPAPPAPAAPLEVLVVDAAGHPLPGAAVEARPSESVGGYVNPVPAAHTLLPAGDPARATTGEDGRARFDGLPAGWYDLAGRAPGFAPGVRLQVPCPAGTEPPAAVVVLGAAHALEGIVRGADGRPVAGATVSLPGPGGPAETRSGPDGRWRVDGLAAGYRRVEVEVPGGNVRHSRTVLLPLPGEYHFFIQSGETIRGRAWDASTGGPAVGAEIRFHAHSHFGEPPFRGSALTDGGGWYEFRDVPPGVDCRTLTGVLHGGLPATGPLGASWSGVFVFRPGGAPARPRPDPLPLPGGLPPRTVRGRVLPAGGALPPGLVVRRLILRGPSSGSPREAWLGRAARDPLLPTFPVAEDGTFEAALPADTPAFLLFAVPEEGPVGIAGPFPGGEAAPAAVSIPLDRARSVAGEVVAEPGGDPLPGAVVEWSGESNPEFRVWAAVAVAGPDGRFRAPRPDGEGFLRARAPGRRGPETFVSRASGEDGVLLALPVLPPPPTGKPRPFAMDPLPPVAPGRTIAGRVLDEEGRPLVGVRVRTMTGAPGPGFTLSDWTDGEGRFVLHGVPPSGDPVLDVSGSPLHRDLPGFTLHPRPAEWEIRLVAHPRIEGRVVDGEGRPLAEFQVRGPGRATAWTDAGGAFRIAVEDGRPLVLRGSGGGAILDPTEPIPPGGEPVVLRPRPLGAVTGRVVDGEGRPLAAVEVLVDDWRFGGTRHRRGWSVRERPRERRVAVSTDGGGRFVARGLDPRGTYEVTAGGRETAWLRARAEGVRTGGPETVLVLLPAPRVRGRVVDPAGRPVAGAAIHLPGEGEAILTGGDGTFSFRAWDSLPDGRTVRILPPGDGLLGVGPLAVGGGTRFREVRLKEPGSFRGRVVDGEGIPVPGARVYALPADGSDPGRVGGKAAARAGFDGRFLLPSLDPEGRFDLFAAPAAPQGAPPPDRLPPGTAASAEDLPPGPDEVRIVLPR